MAPRYPDIRKIPLPGGPSVSTLMVRDNYKRHKFAENEMNWIALRYIARNTLLPMKVRLEAQLQMASMPNYTRSTQYKNRCIITGYGRGVIPEFRMCQPSFKQAAERGELPGVRKASW